MNRRVTAVLRRPARIVVVHQRPGLHADREQLLAGAHRLGERLGRLPGREQKAVGPAAPHVRAVRRQVPDPRREQLDQLLEGYVLAHAPHDCHESGPVLASAP